MTYTEWHTTMDRDPKGYFAAVDLLERIEKALGRVVQNG